MRKIGAIWGVVGIIALLGLAICRLTPYAIEALLGGLMAWQWFVVVAWTGFMIATEGHNGFYRRLAPRIAARSGEIWRSGDALAIVLAPLYCFGYFRAPKKRLVISYMAIILIICAVFVVQQVSQPWRGIIDVGVVAGLLYGVIAIVIVSLRRATST